MTGVPSLSIVPPEDAVSHLGNALAVLRLTDPMDLSPNHVAMNLHAVENRIHNALKLLKGGA